MPAGVAWNSEAAEAAFVSATGASIGAFSSAGVAMVVVGTAVAGTEIEASDTLAGASTESTGAATAVSDAVTGVSARATAAVCGRRSSTILFSRDSGTACCSMIAAGSTGAVSCFFSILLTSG
ncbi:hypothetical protein D9M72_330140 [compost metagenome]